jgi:hypothetical protein
MRPTIDIVSDEDPAMRRHPVRMTLRGLMVAVAIVAVVLGVGLLKKRRDERLKRLAFYSGLEHKYTARAQASTSGRLGNAGQERLDYFRAMRRKWEWAASHPWESVEPDPP